MKRKVAVIIALGVVSGLSASAVYSRKSSDAPSLVTSAVSRGPIVNNVSASGTLEAVTTVEVGTQVSGTIEALNADFNSIVKRGQVLARLDRSLFQSAVEQARANLVRAEAEQQRLQVGLENAGAQLERARQLAARQLIAATDLDAAAVARDSLAAQVRSAAAAVTQARASLGQAQVNLQKATITSPIDGIVIARNVDVGQTVAASLQAPTLFVIAADLSQMQLSASIDESDVGQIKPGQAVTFRVDAYPDTPFHGKVAQVRLNPTVESNVVTYAAMITAANPRLELKPGMTATVTIEVSRRDDVLRVPTAALRFRPSEEALEALGLGTAAIARAGHAAGMASSPKTADEAVVWVQADNTIRPTTVQTGASDGVNTELLGDSLPEGATVVTRVTLPGSTATASQPTARSPLMPSGPPRR